MTGLPNTPVYDLKLKDADLVAATHGRSFWIMDDVSGAARRWLMASEATRLVAPRTTVRSKLHWSAGANVRTGIAYGPAFGIDGSTVMVERPDGTRVREHLDVGENPPVGAIVWYWLAQDAKDGVTLTFRDSAGRKIVTLSSTDKDAAAGAQARHQGRPQPLRLGHALSRPEQDRLFAGAGAAQAAGARSREPARPDRGARHLRRRPRGRRQDPVGQVHRGQGPAPADHAGAVRRSSSRCTRQLVASLSKLKEALNRLRRMKRRLGEVAERTAKSERALRNRANGLRAEARRRSRR